MKPYEVEILVGQVGETPGENELYHVLFDGSVTDEHGYVGIGGRAEEVTEKLHDKYSEGIDLASAIRAAVQSLAEVEAREIDAAAIEAAVLDRTRRNRRKFRRLDDSEIAQILSGA
jgi:proteasome alpha subunit